MAEKAWDLSRLYVMPETTFNTDPSGTGSGYSFLLVHDLAFKPNQAIVERKGQTNDFTRQKHVIGHKSGSLSFKTEVRPSGTPADGTPAVAPELDELFKHAIGQVTRGTGSTVGTGGVAAGATTVPVTASSGFQKYMLIEFEGDVAGQEERRFVASIPSSTSITVNRALTYAHAAGRKVIASNLYTPANTGMSSLAFVADRDGALFTFTGCRGVFKFAGISAGGIPVIEWTFDAASWSDAAKGSLPAPTAATAWAAPAVVKASPAFLDNADLLISEFMFDPGIKHSAKTTTAVADSAADWIRSGREAKGSIKPWYEAAHLSTLVAGTEKSTGIAVGGKSNGFGIYCPKVQFTDLQHENRGGILGLNIPFSVNDNGADSDWAVSVF